MFSQACVIPSVHGGGGVHPMQWAGGGRGASRHAMSRGRGCIRACNGTWGCVVDTPGQTLPPERRPLKRAVRILLRYFINLTDSANLCTGCANKPFCPFSVSMFTNLVKHITISQAFIHKYFLDIILSKHFEKS